MFELDSALINVCHCQILTCGSYGHPAQGFQFFFFFPHRCSMPSNRQSVSTVAFHTITITALHSQSAQRQDTGFDNRGNLSYYSNTFTQGSGLFWGQQSRRAQLKENWRMKIVLRRTQELLLFLCSMNHLVMIVVSPEQGRGHCSSSSGSLTDLLS